MDINEINKIDAEARAHFSYQPDGIVDTWTSYADEVLGGKPWSGDCDDLGCTILDLLGRQGLPLASRFRLLVSTTGSHSVVDHFVGCVEIEGKFWIVGDTFVDHPYLAEQMHHHGIEYNCLGEGGEEPVWRDGVPWKIVPEKKNV